MEGRVSIYCHVLQSWKVYPRTDYFRRRYRCLMQRLPRVIEHLPTRCQDQNVLLHLRNFNDLLARKPRIIVVGKENIDLHQMVVDPQHIQTVSEELTDKEGLTIVVCHIDVFGVEHNEIKEAEAVITFTCTEYASANMHNNFFVVCDLHGPFTDQQLEYLHGILLEHLQSQPKDWTHSDGILFGSGSGLHNDINKFFEDLVIENLEMLNDFVQQFQLPRDVKQNFHRNKRKIRKTNALDSDIVVKTIRGFLRDNYFQFSEHLRLSEGTFLDQILINLAMAIRCAVIQSFKDRYDIPPWVCKEALLEYGFVNNLVESVSEKTLYYLRQKEIYHDFFWVRKEAELISDFILNRLQSDMSAVVDSVEDKMSVIRRMLINTGKFNYEINGYLRQSFGNRKSSEVRLSENGKRRFSDVGGIYFENGSKIWNSDHFGTLGSFVSSSNNALFALTCAHVVHGGTHFICAQHKNGKQMRFAVTVPEMTLVSGNSSLPLVDIAAVKVYDRIRGMCDQYLKDDDGERKEAKLSYDKPVDLIGSFVYQYGATTGFKKGIIVPNDCFRFGDNADEYILNVECLAGAESEHFAEPGDSGAVICMTDIDTNTVKAVGMVHGGVMSDRSCLAFHLGKALNELAKKSGEQLHL